MGSGGSILAGVDAVSQADAWAVGSASEGSLSQTLAERWDGSAWSVVSTPNVGTGTNTLGAVDAVSTGDVWAVGFYDNGATFRTLAEHWDGSWWKVAATPNVGSGENVLTSVSAVAGNDVWAVGYRQDVPHSTYLVTMVAGPFVEVEQTGASVPVFYYVLPGREADGERAFGKTPRMMAVFLRVRAVGVAMILRGRVDQRFPRACRVCNCRCPDK